MSLQALIEFNVRAGLHDIPADVREETQRMFADYLGCIVAARASQIEPVVAGAAAMFGGAATLAGRTYAHARLADALDLSEGYGGAHFGAGVVAAALALGAGPDALSGVSGGAWLAALALGYETAGRVMDAVGPYFDEIDGHARYAPIWGVSAPVVYGAAATAARLLSLDEATTAHAFALAGAAMPIPTGGVWERVDDSPNVKFCDAGWCALAGVMGAVAAASGSTGLTGLSDGEHGLLRILGARRADPRYWSDALGSYWRIRRIAYKDWPCCGLNIGPMAGMRALARELPVPLERVARWIAEVGLAGLSPNAVNRAPHGFAARQFSIPHSMAMLAFDVPPGAAWVSDAIADHPRIAAFRDRVEVVAHRRPWTAADSRGQPAGTGRNKPCAVRAIVGEHEFVYESPTDASALQAAPWDDRWIAAKLARLVDEDSAAAFTAFALDMADQPRVAPLIAALDAAQPAAHDWTLWTLPID